MYFSVHSLCYAVFHTSNNKIAADIFKIKQILTAVKTAVCYDNELLEVISFLYFFY